MSREGGNRDRIGSRSPGVEQGFGERPSLLVTLLSGGRQITMGGRGLPMVSVQPTS